MRTSVIATTIGLMLAGCNPTGTAFVPPTPASLQQAIINACGYYAEIGPLGQLIASFVPVPGVSTTAAVVNQLALQVCSAAIVAKTAPAASPSGTVPLVVNGVPITGRFVR